MALADTARLVAALELQDKFTGPAKGAERSLGSLERKVSGLGKIGDTAGRGLGTLVSNLGKIAAFTVGAGVGAGLAGIVVSVKAASDLNEEIDKSAVVFGKAAGKVQAFSENAASIGLSAAEALGAAGNFGNMLNTVGLAQDASADMSVTMVELAADMASFNNEDPSDMLDRLRSGLAGEAEPLRRFGVLLSEAEVKAFAVREGIAGANDTLTEAQKVQARYGLILEQTALQQGNFADTADSLANQQRTLRANLGNTAATMGQAFLPTVGKVLRAINTLFIDKRPQIEEFSQRIGASLDALFSNENVDRGVVKISDFIDKLAGSDGSQLAKGLPDFGGIEASISGVSDKLTPIIEQIKGLPWESIKDSAKLLGTGSKALLDAFLDLPPWVQTAVLTGWGLNKLTGGALGSIVSELGKGLIKGVLGMNAGVVNIKAGVVNGVGPGGGLPGGGSKGPGALAGFLSTLGIFAAVEGGASAGGDVLSGDRERQLAGFRDFSMGPAGLIGRAITDALGPLVDEITGSTDETTDAVHSLSGPVGQQLDHLRNTIPGSVASLKDQVRANNESEGTRASYQLDAINRNRDAVRAMNESEGRRFSNLTDSVAGVKGRISDSLTTLAQIRDRRQDIYVDSFVTVNTQISAGAVAQQVASYSRSRAAGPTLE